MTLNQLKTAVAKLGFERELEDSEALRISANRALRLIFSERPVKKELWLSADAPAIGTRIPIISHNGKENTAIELHGCCFSARAYGKGGYILTDKNGSREASFNGHGVIIRDFFKDEAEISFTGESFFTVHELCSFTSLCSEKSEDIPVKSAYRTIDVKAIAKDFLAFDGMPTDEYGRALKGVTLSDGTVMIPWEMKGQFKLTYRRSPAPIRTGEDKEIDVGSECEELLPLLTAAYLWLDDDAEKAQYYMALYKDALSTVIRYSNSGIDPSYRTNGWA